MIFLQIISSLLFLVSIGSMHFQREKNPDAIAEFQLGWQLILALSPYISIIFLMLNMNNITHLKWYWNLGISALLAYIFANQLAYIYSLFLGYKTEPRLNFFTGKVERQNIHIVDVIITFVIGVILFFIAN